MQITVAQIGLLLGDEAPKYKLHVPLIGVSGSDVAHSAGIVPVTVLYPRV